MVLNWNEIFFTRDMMYEGSFGFEVVQANSHVPQDDPDVAWC